MAMEHLKSLLKSQGVSQTQLAMVLGRDKSAITNLLQGKRKLKAEEVIAIAQYLGVSESRVLGVESKPFQSTNLDALRDVPMLAMAEATPLAFLTPPALRENGSQAIETKDNSSYFMGLTGLSAQHVAVEVTDESMNLSGLLAGDVVVADRGRRAKEGDLVVVQHYIHDAAATLVRRYQPPFLLPHSTLPDQERLHEARETVRIVAPVVRVVRVLE